MSRPHYARSLRLWAPIVLSGTAACLTPRPSPQDWDAVGFRSPRETFQTFQTALAADYPALEYRCLAASLKRREGLPGEIAYREFRDQLRRAMPWFRRLAAAEVVEVSVLADDRRRLIAEVEVLFRSYRFSVDFVREDYFETWFETEPVDDETASFERLVRRPTEDPRRIDVRLESAWDAPITGLSIGREWKIDDFAEAPSP